MAKNIGKNVLLSGTAWLVPSVVAVVTVPLVVRGLGDKAYGVVTLVTAVTGYLYVLDLGLGQGVVRYLSMFVSLGNGRAMRQLIRGVLTWFGGAAALGAIGIWIAAPWLGATLIREPAGLVRESVAAFRIGCFAFVFGMAISILSLMPTAFLRYDYVSIVSVTFGSASLVGPAFVVMLGYGLAEVMWFYLISNAVTCAAWAYLTFRLVHAVPDEGPDLAEYRRGFLSFSLKNGINRIWSVVQAPTSQVVVGISGGVTAAAYFQVPMLISVKVTGLLYQMSTVLLPTGSQMAAEGEHGGLFDLYERSSRLFYVLNASVVGAIAVFSGPLLLHWIGPRYAEEGALAFALLTLAVGLNAVSMTASQMNMALGRPGVNLAFSLANSVINLGTVYTLTVMFGIAGTALSSLLAAAVVPFFLHYSHRHVLSASTWTVFRDCYLRTTVAIIGVSVAAWYLLRPLATGLLVTLALVAVAGCLSLAACAAVGAITRDDWTGIMSLIPARLRRRAGTAAEAETDGADA
jgi:O-antigen/teichoic acid export membrane protein